MSIGIERVIAATRFGYGAKPGDLAQIGDDPRGWLKAQLAGTPPVLTDATLKPSSDTLVKGLELRREKRDEKKNGGVQPRKRRAQDSADADDSQRMMPPGAVLPEAAAAALAMKLPALFRPIYVNEAVARMTQAIATDRPFLERITQFWTNHFAVSIDKVIVLGLAGSHEREAIRPNVLGNFSDLLLAAERHPAMLLYLDNYTSAGPASRAAQRLARVGSDRKLGINENLAREIMELHTLGVQGGYTQADVTSFAKILTGWSLDRDTGQYRFRAELHEPGTKSVLGKRYREAGEGEGQEALRDFAAHPSTARFIATKLVRHFIADDPPGDAVERVAGVFTRSSGHLPSVYAAVVDERAAWAEPFTKFKAPVDFVYSTFRGLELPVLDEKRALAGFELLGQRNYSPGSPAGWPDRSADWDGSSAVLKRIEWSDAVGQRVGARRNAADLAPALFGAALTDATRQAVTRAATGAQAVTLLLTSPEFMRR